MTATPLDAGYKIISTWNERITQKGLAEYLKDALKEKDALQARGAILHKLHLAAEARQGVADYVKAAARAGKYIRAGDFLAGEK